MTQAWTSGVGFLGAGAVGSALARAIHAAGYSVTVIASRSRTSALSLARELPGCQVAETPQQVADRCALVFLTTPDSTIQQVAEAIRWRPNQDVVHCSGGASLVLLASAHTAGASIGGFHPLQTFPRTDLPAARFHGITFGVQADGALLGRLEQLARELGGKPLHIQESDRALYHASAVLVCGAVAALVGVSSDLWASFSTPQQSQAALASLLPLLQGTIEELVANGLPMALTGPVARGDVAMVQRHLEALRRDAPHVIPLYSELGLVQIPLAQTKGTCSAQAAAQLERLFKHELARVA